MDYRATVRYGAMGVVSEFDTELAGLRRGDKIVVRTNRGSEVGCVINGATERGEDAGPSGGEVLRIMTAQDEKEVARVDDEAVPKEMKFCAARIKELSLPMKIVGIEHLLGGEKIIFYFLAEGRVDFRQLVKDVAREYRTRIELRQIGVRDEARLQATHGHCGQKLCCRSFMKTLEPVTMRMAKSQKATLDPTKISGVCGRLMCCLRYEDDLYRELKGNLPKKGSIVVSRKATGKVVDTDILAQTITLHTKNSNFVRIHLDEVTSIEDKASGEKDQARRKPTPEKPAGDSREKGEGAAGAQQGASQRPKSRRGSRRRSPRKRRGGSGGSGGGSGGSGGGAQ